MTELVSQSNQYSVVYGRRIIDFTLFYSNRKTLEIVVHPDSSVVIKAPETSDIDLVERKIKKRFRWIIKQQDYFSQFNPKTPKHCYVHGETHLYLGKQYRLKIDSGAENSVKLSRGFFHITCVGESSPNTVKKVLDQWYLEKAHLQFSKSMDRCWQKFKNCGVEQPKLVIKDMQKRWGSFSSKGIITLNIHLIRAPRDCIDYVVTHELCHLLVHGHSSDFYRLLESCLPDWQTIKHKLELSLV